MLTNSIQQRKILPAAQVGVMRVQDMTMRRIQMAAVFIVSTLASTILMFWDANGLMLVLVYIDRGLV
jgi:hypothetical protein